MDKKLLERFMKKKVANDKLNRIQMQKKQKRIKPMNCMLNGKVMTISLIVEQIKKISL